jgi:hypothetical protein
MKKCLLLIFIFIFNLNLFSYDDYQEYDQSYQEQMQQMPLPKFDILYFNTLEEAEKTLNLFMKEIEKKDINKAFSFVKKYFPIQDSEIDNLATSIIEQNKNLEERFGKLIGYELFNKKVIQDRYAKYIFVVKYQIHILKWHFILYKPEDKWFINLFYYDDKITDLFYEEN